jgi:hypothetical protein
VGELHQTGGQLMTLAPPYTLTNESITVVFKGKSHVVQKGSPQFNALRKAIISEDWDAVPKNLTVEKSIKDWAKGKFTLNDNVFSFEGNTLPSDLNGRIIAMATGGEDPTPLFKFWERLQRNPSMRSVLQLWPFLQHKGIPLTPEGKFLAYKGVKEDFKDAHSGTVDNKPGCVNKMPRNQISDDPNHACHEGYHVGDLSYAKSFAPRVVICEVDPEHVVCVPYDESQRKMRVCEYKVIGQHNGSHLPSTTYKEDTTAFDTSERDADRDPAYVEETSEPKKSGKEKKKAHKAKKKAGKQLVKNFAKLRNASMPDLMNESLDVLRAYAGHGLKIVGASKIPGGKPALVAVILKSRN